VQNALGRQTGFHGRQPFREQLFSKVFQLSGHREPVDGALPGAEVDQGALGSGGSRHLQVRLNLGNTRNIKLLASAIHTLTQPG